MADKQSSSWTRRNMLLGSAAAVTGSVVVRASAAADEAPQVKTYESAEFYGSDGTFREDKARQAYFDMFRDADHEDPASFDHLQGAVQQVTGREGDS